MLKIEYDLVINRTVEKVFAFVANPANHPQFRPSLIETNQTSEGSVGVGTTFQEVEKFLGRKMKSVIEVTAFEKNKIYSIKTLSGPMPFELTMGFEPVEKGTKVKITAQAELKGFFRLIKPIVAPMTRSQIKADFTKLKKVLEAQAE